MKALTIRQPWAHSIVHLGKCIENRSRTTHYRGEILIHASASRKVAKWVWALNFIHIRFGDQLADRLPKLEALEVGGVIGRARIVDVIPPTATQDYRTWLEGHNWRVPPTIDTRWHETDCYGWVLADVEPLPFMPCKGLLNLWNCDFDALRAMNVGAR